MSEEVSKQMTKLFKIGHKCKQTKCKQMSEEFENMKKFVLYSNQLNAYYLNLVVNNEINSTEDQTLLQTQKQALLIAIAAEVKTIDKTLHSLIKDIKEDIQQKQKSPKISCDLCHKQLSPKLLSTHLTEHLTTGSDIIFEERTTTKSTVVLQPFCSVVVKEEQVFNSDDESNYSPDFDGIGDHFSDSEEEVTERVTKTTSTAKEKTNTCLKSKETEEKPQKRKSQTELIMCGECGKRFTTRKLSRHVFHVHRISDKTSNKCHLCDFGNVTIQELKAHLSSEHSLTPNKWNFYCSYPNCGQAFRFRTALEKHIGTHSGELPYKCEWPGCSTQFNKQWKLVEHVRQHTGEKPFKCHWPGCDREFAVRASYRNHVLSHNKDRHVCYYPGCDKSYAFKRYLDDHVRSTHCGNRIKRERDKIFDCPVEGCPKSFSTKQNLNLHLEVHKDRPRHDCPHEGCNRSFLKEESLQKHAQKSHDTIRKLSNGRQLYKDYRCDWPGCEYEANIATNLKIHRMRAHTGEKPEKCQYPGCGFAAVRKFELRVHMLKHTGESPYPCTYPQCSRRFKSQRALDTHIDKTHSFV